MSNILNQRWWSPCQIEPGAYQDLRQIKKVWRGTDGALFHVTNNHITNDKIKATEFKEIHSNMEWNLDFVQNGTIFHTEGMSLSDAHSLVFRPNSIWYWRPKPELCKQIVVSLRIGGYLLDTWKMEDTSLDIDTDYPGRYALRGKCENYCPVDNNSVLEYQYGAENYGYNDYFPKWITTFLLRANYGYGIQFEMNSPAKGRDPFRYDNKNPHQIRNLLLDWAKCRGHVVGRLGL